MRSLSEKGALVERAAACFADTFLDIGLVSKFSEQVSPGVKTGVNLTNDQAFKL